MKYFSIEDQARFKMQALAWANSQSSTICYLDSNAYTQDRYHRFECLLGVGAWDSLAVHEGAFDALSAFAERHKGEWLLGHLNYDLKNEVERLSSNNLDTMGWAALHFFVPVYLIGIDKKGRGFVASKQENPQAVFEAIVEKKWTETNAVRQGGEVQARISKQAYLEAVGAIRQHIIDGDIYEMNFCQEFYSHDFVLNPLAAFRKLNAIGKAPFSAYYQKDEKHLLCASPERFIQKRGQELISQPIKGTVQRGRNAQEDADWQETLRQSEKDQAENVMIVDLVRNDLSRSCQVGTVRVEELFEVYGFEQVFQLISTIRGELRPDTNGIEALKRAFPMGSMTGAPKVMSMKLIEQYEMVKRGLYSGSIGYITPTGDYDFNVVIRSLFYDTLRKYTSFQVGGAIVYDSDPEQEYAECLLKAKGMLNTLAWT